MQPAASVHGASQFNERNWPAWARRESAQPGRAAALCSGAKIARKLHATMRRGQK